MRFLNIARMVLVLYSLGLEVRAVDFHEDEGSQAISNLKKRSADAADLSNDDHSDFLLMKEMINVQLALSSEAQLQTFALKLQTVHPGSTLLRWAMIKQWTELFHALIKSKVDLEVCDENQDTVLHVSAKLGLCHFVRALIAAKANLDAGLERKRTPLNGALLKKQQEVVAILVEAKANVFTEDRNQNTLLHFAVFHKQPEAVRALVSGGVALNAQNKERNTALHLAVKGHQSDVVQFLINSQADLEIRDADGNAALHLAVMHDYPEMVRFLAKAQANLDSEGQRRRTALCYAVINDDAIMVRLLISLGVNQVIEDQDRNTPLHLAACCGHSAMVRLLVEAHANVNAQNQDLNTPLYFAAANGHPEVISRLIEYKADFNLCDRKKNAPLHVAAEEGYEDSIQSLIEGQADVNTLNARGNTPLHIAVMGGHRQVLEILIRLQANVAIKNQDGVLPLHLAIAVGYSDLAIYLLSLDTHSLNLSLGATQAILLMDDELLRVPPESRALDIAQALLESGSLSDEEEEQLEIFMDEGEALRAFQKQDVQQLKLHGVDQKEINSDLLEKDLEQSHLSKETIDEFSQNLYDAIEKLSTEYDESSDAYRNATLQLTLILKILENKIAKHRTLVGCCLQNLSSALSNEEYRFIIMPKLIQNQEAFQQILKQASPPDKLYANDLKTFIARSMKISLEDGESLLLGE